MTVTSLQFTGFWSAVVPRSPSRPSGPGIPYELKGDTLHICQDLSGAKCLTGFKSVAGTKLYLVTYNCQKE